MLPVTLAAWAGWRETAEGPREAGWTAGADAAEPVPVLLRRRIDRPGQAALRLAWGMAAARRARIVASSRHGALARSLAIMKAVQAGEPASPAEFSLSVHHALAGLLSIAQGNRAGHTAVAAGAGTLAAGLLEAVAGLDERGALLMHLADPLPAPFDAALAGEVPACTLVLALMPGGEGQAMTLQPVPCVAERDGADGPEAVLWDFLADPGRREVSVGGGRMALLLRRTG